MFLPTKLLHSKNGGRFCASLQFDENKKIHVYSIFIAPWTEIHSLSKWFYHISMSMGIIVGFKLNSEIGSYYINESAIHSQFAAR